MSFANTTITAANAIAAGTLTVAGTPVPAHCQVTGKMFQRVSAVDGNSYAIGFEMRLPNAWNGRFFYQANGGIDGSVVTATGGVNGGGGLTNALTHGLRGDQLRRRPRRRAGPVLRHRPAGAARLRLPGRRQADADGQGRDPDRLRQGPGPLVLRRLLERRAPHDGRGRALRRPVRRLPGRRPGLPPAARGDRQHRRRTRATPRVATDAGRCRRPASPPPSARWSPNAVLAKCDALDGATDGLVQDTKACQAAFDLDRDVPTCTGARDGTCLSRGAEDRDRQALRRRDDQHRHEDLLELAVRRRHRHAAAGRSGSSPRRRSSTPARSASSGRCRRRTRPTFNGPTFALTGNVDTDARQDPGHQCDLHRERRCRS